MFKDNTLGQLTVMWLINKNVSIWYPLYGLRSWKVG